MVNSDLCRRFLLVFSFLLVFASVLKAQDIGSIDFKNLKSSDLSDQQVQRLWQRAQDKGYTISQLKKLAIARGASSTEVSKIIQRLRRLRMGTGQNERQNSQTQLRSVTTDSLGFFGADSLRKDTTKSRIFGAELFRRDNVTFTPSLNIATPQSYNLGPGDELVIDIWGAAEQTYQKTVSPEGTIAIANLGPVYVNGLSIREARSRIRSSLKKIYSGLGEKGNQSTDTHARISLGNIRSISVTVLGDVRNPGTFTVPSLATAFNALYSAGGPTDDGTFRNIKIIRDDSTVANLDIYDFLVYGKQEDNIRLRDQDIIQVSPYISRIEVTGKMKREGLFELKKEETVQDLVNFVGGFAQDAYKKQIKVVGNTETQKRISDIAYPEEKGFHLTNGDSVHVGEILDRFKNRVQIEGAVYRPGDYELKDSTSLHSLIKRAQGVREDVFKNRGLIYREKKDLTTKAIPFSVKGVLKNPEENDIMLERNDIVQISSIFDLREDYMVNIVGAVQNPGKFEYVENMSLEDIIFQADGFKESAAPYRIEVSRRITGGDSSFVPRESAKIFRFQVDEDLELNTKASEFTIQPFDQVYVRNSPSYSKQKQVKIKGEVLFPGEYTIDEQNMRISELIQRAGGITQYAYPKGGNLTRRIKQKVDTSIINIPDTTTAGNALQQKTTKVGIQLNKILENPDSPSDLILREGDVLEVPQKLQTVQVSGEVLYPVSVRYKGGLSFKDYLRAAGGTTNLGVRKDSYIVYANGEVDRARKFLFFKNYPDVRPGATIYVPGKKKERELTTQERIGILSAIVSMAAIVSNTIFQIRRN